MALAARLESGLGTLLPGFLARQRWFGAKSRPIAGVELADLAWLGHDAAPLALAIMGIRYADGGRERYALVLGLDGAGGNGSRIGTLPPPGDPVRVREAAGEADAVVALLGATGDPEGLPTLRGGRLRPGDGLGAAGRRFDPRALDPATIRPVGSEQSNTSLRLGPGHVLKLFRKLESGENPELEVGRFLTERTSFRAMAALHGSWTHHSPAGERTTIGIVQDWIENRGDGWSHVLAALDGILRGIAEAAPLAADIRALGEVTAGFHLALASRTDDPAFAPRPVDAFERTAWRTARARQAERALSLLERCLDTLAEPARSLARRVTGARARVMAIAGRETAGAPFHAIRVHGDYHLGQTLKTAEGFTIIDFEGEPARPLAERRARQCALKDVAGMLRSFDYAIETARANLAGKAPATAAPPLRETYLEAYLARAAGAVFLPAQRQDVAAWTDLFELDKALYEVEYELNHRPAWVTIPLSGITRILERRA